MRKLITGTIRIMTYLLILSLGCFTAWGADKEDTKSKILEIKLNENFIFGEGISDNKEIAYGDALEDLLAFANELKIENALEEISISDLIPKVETLTYKEGERFEVIVYIPFKIIIDTPRKSSPDPTPESLQIEVAESGLKEVPMVENKTALQPEQKESIEDFLITQENFTEIKPFLSESKKSGRIKETGASESFASFPPDASLILIDDLGGLLAILSPETGQGRINYKTKKLDSENNYNSKFIVWYRK